MGAPKIYRWDDTDAPIGNGARGSLINILKACLVDGYGSKQAAGWTMPFVNAAGSQAAFRNNPTSGTGFFLHVDNESPTDYYQYQNKIQAYESMSDYQTGLGQFNSGTQWYFLPSTVVNGDASPRPWLIIADDRCFYLWSWASKTDNTVGAADYQTPFLFFGDIICRDQNDTWGCVLNADASVSLYSNNPWAMYASGTAGSASWRAPRKADGTGSAWQLAMIHGGGPCNTPPGNFGLPYTQGGPLYLSRPFFNDGVAYTFRGHLPGLYFPCHSGFPFDNFQELDVDGKTMMAVNCYNYASHALVLIDISASFRP
ncbi:hypothetical protein DGMP_06680 [Desulfomarina profundi]|uniref:Uncharacterized protein n=1 Tax=Desulfomarina profundi TaxID=2772557 RepID=A0A8D5JNC6_9BACT|nr:hypothetical protein [Desulfomarina profundi]BCL59975.1 hypothetical protein DGMP_06680 [Desulfomarina profundi]